MVEMIKNVTSVACGRYVFVTENMKRKISYVIETENGKLVEYNVILPFNKRLEKSETIVSYGDDFINGFMVVQTDNLEFAYINEDRELLPYRYDIATDFNEYGYAMVAKDGKVSWINKNFQYFSCEYKMVDENDKFDGFQKIIKFSDGKYPLSRICDGRERNKNSFYFGIDGRKKEFYQYIGEIDYSKKYYTFNGLDFKNKDYIFSSEGILFSKGYYCPMSYVIEFFQKMGIEDYLYSEIEECSKQIDGQMTINEYIEEIGNDSMNNTVGSMKKVRGINV